MYTCKRMQKGRRKDRQKERQTERKELYRALKPVAVSTIIASHLL
jgi:hypothetical protein